MSPSILQELPSNTVPVNLDELCSEGCHGLTVVDIVETIWAITKHIYTDDEVVLIDRLDVHGQNPSGSDNFHSRKFYSVDDTKSAAQVHHTSSKADRDTQENPDVEELTADLPCSQWVRRAGLVVSRRPNASSTSEQATIGPDRLFLQVFVDARSPGLTGYLHFPENQALEDTMIHVASTIEQICLSVLRDWNSPIAGKEFISSLTSTHISGWSKTPKQDIDACLGDIIMKQAADRPSQIFIEAWDGDLSFSELYDHSTAMAQVLLEAGVKVEDRVLFCMRKSKWAVVAVLGILLAGGTCVPIDINAPQKRVEALVQQTESGYAVVDRTTCSLYDGTDVQVFNEIEKTVRGRHTPSILLRPASHAAAFIYFTSGSTGIPKGVLQQHGKLYAKLVELSKTYSLTEKSRVFQYANHVFDPSIGDIFGAMLGSARLCIPSEEQRIGNLTDAIASFQATHASMTNTVIAQIKPEKVPTLRHLFVGGESLDKIQLGRWSQQLNLNTIYGTTESLIYDSVAPCAPIVYRQNNLGRDFGTCLWVVNTNSHDLKPLGAVGEILIEGPLLALGYLNDPTSTETRFVCAPGWLQKLRDGEAARCYKTGDVGFQNADGSVTFIGRADTQVKIRGQRVELSEIEHNFKLVAPVLDQVVVDIVVDSSRKDVKTLAAFMLYPGTETTDGSIKPGMLNMNSAQRHELETTRARLSELLPQYMVPTLFVPVSKLPLTPSGKLDRKILRNWIENADAARIKEYHLSSSVIRSPETDAEFCLQVAWAQTLDIPVKRVSTEDSFFTVGGDSILAMQLAETLRDAGKTLAVTDMFRFPRLRDMATRLASNEARKTGTTDYHRFALIQHDSDVEKCVRKAAEACRITIEQVQDIYPTYPMQEALMAISAHRAGAYQHRLILRLSKALDVLRFKSAWQTVLMAQPILRTRIVLIPDMGPLQVVTDTNIAWSTELSLQEYLQQDNLSPMTYGSQLCRFAIVAHDEGSSFVWTLHHALYDGWTEPRILDAVWRAYEGLDAEPTTMYTNFIDHVRSLDLEKADQFWREQFLAVTDSYPSLPSPTYQPKSQEHLSMSVELHPRTGTASTTATVLQAAWALVLSQYTNSHDVSFGLLLSGRDAPVEGITKIMGPTIASVPFWHRLDPSTSIRELLLHVQDHVVELRRFQHVGLQRIRRLSPEASAAANFRNVLIIHPADNSGAASSYNKLGVQVVDQEDTDFMDTALTIDCTIGSKAVDVTAQFDQAVISGNHVQRALNLFHHIVALLATKPETTSLQDLDLISQYDLDQLGVWNSSIPDPLETTLHSLVEAQVCERPNAIAVHSGSDGDWTYTALDSMATVLAQHIAGTTKMSLEKKVVLSFNKSPWAIIAMLAVLKSGGACVSVNPGHPTERLIEIADEVGATLLLCDGISSQTKFASYFQHSVVVDAPLLASLKDREGSNRHFPKVSPSNAAFIVFTSGSTGKPKGSLLEHRSLATSLMENGKQMHMQPETRTLQFAAYTFDFHIHEIFATLIHGGCVCVISEDDRISRLSASIKENKVNWLMLTSTVAGLIKPTDVPEVQTLVLGGEPVVRRVVEEWAPRAKVIGTYGPSECSVAASIKPLSAGDDPRNIGLAVGCRLWVAERDRPQLDKLASIGRIGELLIEGPIVGRHYVNRPEATSQAFVVDPPWTRHQSSDTQRRFYRTGDLAKFNDDGTITFYGRADTQVKLRGQRIELGEIEYHIKSVQPSFSQVAVEVVNVPQQESKLLIAFVSYSQQPNDSLSTQHESFMTLDGDIRQQLTDVKLALTKKLPSYMIPTLLLPVHEMPQSTSAKLDRKLLRQWFAALDGEALAKYHLSKNLEKRDPTTGDEQTLQSLWAKLLKVPAGTVRAEDDFFEIGGDSVMAMELIVSLRDLGHKLTIAQIFQNPRLCDMARVFDAIESSTSPMDTLPFELLPASASIDDTISAAAQACNISSDSIEDMYPATPMQEALMAISAHRDGAYHYQAVFRISQASRLDVARFQHAWSTFVNAQTVLRSRIIVLQGTGSTQVILKPNGIKWRTSGSLQRYLRQDRVEPMSYGAELTRFSLISEASDIYFVWTAHHAIYDGWSLRLIFEEVASIYQSQEMSVQPPVSYGNFIRYLTSVDPEEAASFWQAQFPTITETYPRIPSDYTPQPRQTKTFTMDYERKIGSGTTISTVLQAAWALVLSQRTGVKEEAIFGLTLFGRDSPMAGIDKMIGPSMTTIPLRVCIDHAESVSAFLKNVQNSVAQIRPFQHTGLQRIRRLNARTRAAADFQNLLVVHSGDDTMSAFQSIGLQAVQHQQEDFLDLALTLDCTVDPNSIKMVFQYDNHVVTDKEADHLFHQFEHTIAMLLKSPDDTSLSAVALLSTYDEQKLHEFNQNELEVVESTVHALVETQVATRPNEIAISDSERDVTYAEFDKMATVLAARLSMFGVGIEQRVILCFAKSAWPIVAMYAILKAGGVCVSVDHKHPTSRILEICDDADASVILCDQVSVSRFSDHVAHVLVVDSSFFSRSDLESDWVQPTVLPTDASFVVYTSGSTGKPKGCVLEHRSVCTSQVINSRVMAIGAGTRALQFASFTFDASICEIFAPLCHGGCVCMISDEERVNDLVKAINDRQADWMMLTPTVAQLFGPAAVPTIKTLVFGGEALSRQVLRSWLNHDVYLVNYWGPSECANSGCVNNSLTIDTDTMNIGHASGHHIWITERDNPDRMVPVGCVGELVVEGPMLSRGYVNRPEQNAKSFIMDPAWSRGQSPRSRRFYRTGDLARFNPDGSITFAGRADNQVKIRGQRVELGEVEHNLRLCEPLFEQVVVEIMTLGAEDENQSLIAIVSYKDSSKDKEGLIPASEDNFSDRFTLIQDSLSQRLPRYMVPSIFLPVYKMPLTPSGKLDRRTLRNWVTQLNQTELLSYLVAGNTASQPLQTTEEMQLQDLWAKLLNVEKSSIGGSDHFFRMGGDSVMAMLLVAALRGAGYHLTVADMFRYPELQAMAQNLRSSDSSTDQHTFVEPFSLINATKDVMEDVARHCAIDVEAIEDIYPCTPMQEGLMAISAHQTTAYVQQEVYKLQSSVSIDRLKSAWQRLVEAQAILRTRIVNLEGIGSLQVVVKSEVEWQEHTSLKAYLREDKKTPMTYGGNLSRLAIVGKGSDMAFVWTAHHAVYDGFSVARIIGEIRYFYEGGRVRSMIPYNRFVRHIQSQVSTEDSSEFWKGQFPDIPRSYPSLPSTRYEPRPDQKWVSNVSVTRKLGSSITTATVVQAAWALVTSKYAGADEALYGLTLSGRDTSMVGISEVVGPTISTVPIRISLDYTKTVLEFLNDVQEQMVMIRQHQHFGLQNIRQLCTEAQSAADFQNLLVVQPAESAEFQSTLDAMGFQRVDCLEGDFFNYPLVLECTLNANSIRLEALYDSKVIPNGELECMMHQLEHVISQLTKQSDTVLVHNIDMVSPHDRSLFAKWSEAPLPDVQATVHDKVKEQSLAHPDTIALCGLNEQWTYSQLDDFSTRLASHLVTLGIGPEIRVVLCFTKSVWPIIAMLAILKAGGVCVSTNPEHPPSRLLEICEDVKAPVVLCDREGYRVFENHITHIVAVDNDFFTNLESTSTPSPTDDATPVVSPGNAAFIVYTSGTTGKPKGSVLEHNALATSLIGIAQASNMDEHSRTLQFSAYTFDAHILEIFGTLIAGGCVCFISESERMNMLERAMAELSVNWSLLTPTVSRLLVPQNIPTLKNLILSGEPLAQQDYVQWTSHLQLWNGLGPSECSILACMTRSAVEIGDDPKNIGHPLNCNLWITERHRPDRLVPVGCAGEMLVEGAIVGREYNNRPKATASAFITDPAWAKTDGARRRFYRTGDLAKFNPDGSVIFIGRADTQIKIRGQRVEPGEVEKNVQKCLAEKGQVVVDLIKPANKAAGAMLMAFIAFDNSTASKSQISATDSFALLDGPSTRELVAKLKGALPSYMVPSAYIILHKLPVTPNGKMDRAALKKLAVNITVESLLAQHATATEIERPTSGMEVKLARLWASVLDINPDVIGRATSFLHLGGDSIRAMKLVAAARREALRLTIADIFVTPLLSEMASAVSLISDAEKAFTHEPFSTLGSSNNSEFIDRVIKPQLQEPGQVIEDVTILTDFQASCVKSVLRKPRYRLLYVISPFSAEVDSDKLLWACQKLVDRHDQLRTVFVSDSERQRYLQVVLRSLKVNIGMVETTDNIMDFSKSLALDDINDEFTAGQAWARFWVVRDHNQRTCLVTRLCHAQYDGTSLPVLLQDLQDLLCDRQLTPVTPFTSYMSSIAAGSTEEGFKYWGELLDGAKITPLPPLGPAASTQDSESGQAIRHVEKFIPMPQSCKNLTMASMISTVYAMVISDLTASKDVVFGQMMSGRNVPIVGVDQIMGACINMVPTRVRSDACNDFTKMVDDLQSQKVASTKYEYYRFSDTVQHLPHMPDDTRIPWLIFHQNNAQITTTAFTADLHTPPVPAVIDDEITLVTDAHGDQLKVLLMGRQCRADLMDALMTRLETYLASIKIRGDTIELDLPLN